MVTWVLLGETLYKSVSSLSAYAYVKNNRSIPNTDEFISYHFERVHLRRNLNFLILRKNPTNLLMC